MVESTPSSPKMIALSTGTILRAFLVVLAIGFLFVIRHIIGMVLAAIFLAVLMEPFADALERRRVPRSLAAFLVYIVSLGIFSGLLYLIFPPAIEELGNFLRVFAPYVQSVSGIEQEVLFGHGLADGLARIFATIQAAGITAAVPQILSIGTSAFYGIVAAAIVLILAYYLVAEKQAMVRAVSSVTPAQYQPFIVQVAGKLRERLGAWLRGEVLLMFSIFLLTYTALLAAGIPYALTLALLAGFLEIIPFIGPLVSGIPAVILALTISPFHALLIVGLYVLIQFIEGHFLVPKVMQRVTGMNPLVSLLAVLIGWKIGGVGGAFLAIPIANALSVIAEEVWMRKVQE